MVNPGSRGRDSSPHHITDILRTLQDEIEHRGIIEEREDRMRDRLDRQRDDDMDGVALL